MEYDLLWTMQGPEYAVQVHEDDVQDMKIKKEELITVVEDEEPTSEEIVPTADEIREELELLMYRRTLTNAELEGIIIEKSSVDWSEEASNEDDDDYIPYKRKRLGKRKKGELKTESDDEDLVKLGAVEQLLNRHRKKEITSCSEREQHVSRSDEKYLESLRRDRIVKEDMDLKDENFMKRNIEGTEMRLENESISQDEEDGYQYLGQDIGQYTEEHRENGGSNVNLQDYITKVSNEYGTTFSCTLCGKLSKQKGNLMKHVESVHFPNSFSHQCKYCDQIFCTKNNLYVHISKFHKNK